MSLHDVGRYVLGYTVLAGGVTVAALFGAALWAGFPLQLLAMILVVPALLGGLVLAADADHAVEATGDSIEAKFIAETPFSSERTLSAVPGRYAIGFFLVGLGVDAILGVWLLSALP